MKTHKNNQDNSHSRRKFIQHSTVLGTGIMLAGSSQLIAENNKEKEMVKNITSRGYAARDNSGKLSPWSFERRAVGDNDVLIEIKYSGICHSDILQMKGDWGAQQYPQVPGHEIAGIVAAVGKM